MSNIYETPSPAPLPKHKIYPPPYTICISTHQKHQHATHLSLIKHTNKDIFFVPLYHSNAEIPKTPHPPAKTNIPLCLNDENRKNDLNHKSALTQGKNSSSDSDLIFGG